MFSNALNLFLFLNSIKGIGSKGVISIINSSGGANSLISTLLNPGSKLNISQKYPPLIIGAISKKSNKALLNKLLSPQKNIRSEVTLILKEMELDEKNSNSTK